MLIPGSIIESSASVGNLFASISQTPVVRAASEKVSPQAHYDLEVQEMLSKNQCCYGDFSVYPSHHITLISVDTEPENDRYYITYERQHPLPECSGVYRISLIKRGGVFIIDFNVPVE